MDSIASEYIRVGIPILDEGDPSKQHLSKFISKKPSRTVDIFDAASPKFEKFEKLKNLKRLYEDGFVTKTEYEERKSQLIDELTGTRSSYGGVSLARSMTIDEDDSLFVPRGPPDFSRIPAERAMKSTYDLTLKTWHDIPVMVKIDPIPFARGGLRVVYHLTETDDENEEQPGGGFQEKKHPEKTYVAKISRDPRDTEEIYRRDIEVQEIARYYAEKFNEYKPPKKVEFVKAWILRLVSREGEPICGVEEFIKGHYRKHNGNFGYVSDVERNTPQAFSHFSYECSGHKLLMCDIQGVEDKYTDPQVHTLDGKGFGKGNLGKKGMDEFLKTHRCNPICRYLKLPLSSEKLRDIGTLPVERVMNYERVTVTVPVDVLDRHKLLSAHARSDGSPSEPDREDGGCHCVIL